MKTMKNWLKITTGVAALSTLAACSGGGSDSPSAATNSNSIAFKSLSTAIDSGGGLVANTVGAASLSKYIKSVTTFGKTSEEIWNMTGLTSDPRCSGDENNNGMDDDPYCSMTPSSGVPATQDLAVKELVGFLSDPNAVRGNGSSISVFGRIKTALSTPCALATILGGEGGIPTASEQKTITFTAAHVADIQAACGMDISDKIGASITAQFEPTTDKTYYDTILTITMGGTSISNYLRVTDAAVSVSSIENNTEDANGGTRTGAYRTFVYLDRVTGALSGEYLSFSSNTAQPTQNTGEFHRLYVNKDAGEGVMISAQLVRHTDAGSKYEQTRMFVLTGKPGDATSNTGFVFIRAGDAPFGAKDGDYASGASLFAFSGCAKQSDASFVSSDIETCAGAGTAGLGATMKTKLQNLIDNVEVSKVTAASVTGETGGVKFANGAAVFSTDIALGN